MDRMPIGTARRVLPESGRGQPRVVIGQDEIEFLRGNWDSIGHKFLVCSVFVVHCTL